MWGQPAIDMAFQRLIRAVERMSARRELAQYLEHVQAGAPEEHAIILAHALLLFARFRSRYPDFASIIERDHPGTDAQMEQLLFLLAKAEEDSRKNGETKDAAGAQLWIHILRTHQHPALLPLGANVWAAMDQARPLAVSYLTQRRHRSMYQNELGDVLRIDEALAHQGLTPRRYVSAYAGQYGKAAPAH